MATGLFPVHPYKPPKPAKWHAIRRAALISASAVDEARRLIVGSYAIKLYIGEERNMPPADCSRRGARPGA